MPTPLEINFHGPFVFRFTDEYAWAYAAECPNHYLEIITDKNDVTVLKNTEYELTNATKGKHTYHEVVPVATKKWDGNWPTNKNDWSYLFKFPAPESIFGLGQETVTIKYEDGTVSTGYFARGLRFTYLDSSQPDFAGITDAIHYDDGQSIRYMIEIRYQDRSVNPDPKYRYTDAKQCSKNMLRKLPPCDQWDVQFPDAESTDAQMLKAYDAKKYLISSGSSPRDCGAPVLVCPDGITF